jgi:hypothetical protein
VHWWWWGRGLWPTLALVQTTLVLVQTTLVLLLTVTLVLMLTTTTTHTHTRVSTAVLSAVCDDSPPPARCHDRLTASFISTGAKVRPYVGFSIANRV